MRRIALSVTSFLIACGGETPAPQPPPAPTATGVATAPTTTATETATAPPPAPKRPLMELQQAAGKTIAEAFQAGDAKKLASVYTPNAVFKMAGMPDMSGRDAIEKSVGEFFKAVSKIDMGEQRVFVKNDVVISEWVMKGTHSGDFMGMKATEKPVGWVGASVAWFTDDGLIKEEHMYWNGAVVASQVGVNKEKNRGVPTVPSGRPEIVVAKGGADDEAGAGVMKQVNAAWEKKDEKAFGALLAETAEWDDITLPEPYRGKAGVLKYFKALNTGFSDVKLTTTNEWGFGEWVVEEGTFSGTNTGSLFGSAPTKKAVTIHELTISKIDKDKKIVKAITYGNDLEMSAQLNPPKAPPAKPADKPPAKPTEKPAPKK